jgi:hypothetical protein
MMKRGLIVEADLLMPDLGWGLLECRKEAVDWDWEELRLDFPYLEGMDEAGSGCHVRRGRGTQPSPLHSTRARGDEFQREEDKD